MSHDSDTFIMDVQPGLKIQIQTQILVLVQMWTVALGVGTDVIQSPTLVKVEGEDATFHCQFTRDYTYDQMYWYRQRPGELLKPIVFTTAFSAPEYDHGFTQDKFPAQKPDPQTGSLTVLKVAPADRGVYFCSVSQSTP